MDLVHYNLLLFLKNLNMDSCLYYKHTYGHMYTYLLSQSRSPLSHLKLHSKSSCDHFKNYFLLLNFANNLLSILADVSVFQPLGTWLGLFSSPMLKIKEMAQMWPNTLEKLSSTRNPQSPYSCDLHDPFSNFFFSIREDVSNYGPLRCQGWHHSDVCVHCVCFEKMLLPFSYLRDHVLQFRPTSPLDLWTHNVTGGQCVQVIRFSKQSNALCCWGNLCLPSSNLFKKVCDSILPQWHP